MENSHLGCFGVRASSLDPLPEQAGCLFSETGWKPVLRHTSSSETQRSLCCDSIKADIAS
jgi:hypothetical protein